MKLLLTITATKTIKTTTTILTTTSTTKEPQNNWVVTADALTKNVVAQEITSYAKSEENFHKIKVRIGSQQMPI